MTMSASVPPERRPALADRRSAPASRLLAGRALRGRTPRLRLVQDALIRPAEGHVPVQPSVQPLGSTLGPVGPAQTQPFVLSGLGRSCQNRPTDPRAGVQILLGAPHF